MNDKSLLGKIAIVTGAGGGIGVAYSRGLAEAGAKVALADVNIAAATTAADALAADGFEAIAVPVDVSQEDSTHAMAKTVAERFGGIDILVNNAALMAEVTPLGGLTTIPLDVWHRTIAVNLTGPLLCVRAVLPYLKEKGYGKIVNQSLCKEGNRYVYKLVVLGPTGAVTNLTVDAATGQF